MRLHGTSAVFAALLALAGGAAPACHSAPRAAEALDRREFGTFIYRMHLDGREEQGRFTVALDTVTIDPESGDCRPQPAVADRTVFVFTCTAIGEYVSIDITVDTRNPRQHSTWRGAHRVVRQRRICVAYTRSASGQEVCSRYGNENYEVTVTNGGALAVKPFASP